MRKMIKLRIDVDYPYPSRVKSFYYTVFKRGAGKSYLQNAKIIARMINQSPEEVRAYWFFTYKTIPDKELLDMLDEEKHEVCLHVVNRPFEELQLLEKATGRKLQYYTIHGTARLLARVIWKRWKTKTPEIPEKFPLDSFHQFSTFGLDWFCHVNTRANAVQIAEKKITDGKVLHIHPVWLFQRGTINRRGPFYGAFSRILKVDEEMKTLVVRKKLFFKVAMDKREYVKDIIPQDDFIEKLTERGVDIFTFIERKWCNTIINPPLSWLKTEDNIALLQLTSYEEWWKNVGKKTRNMVRKAGKSGVETEVVELNDKLVEGIWKIYNETPIRQDRSFPHYGNSLHIVKRSLLQTKDHTFIGAFFEGELSGFIQLIHGDKTAVISQILSLQKHFDKAVNNALIAKAVEFCTKEKITWIIYGRMGNHPSLDKFKQSNGFFKLPLNRYYVPITRKGQIAIRMGLHREAKDFLPEPVKSALIPVYNWTSRNKIRIKRT